MYNGKGWVTINVHKEKMSNQHRMIPVPLEMGVSRSINYYITNNK